MCALLYMLTFQPQPLQIEAMRKYAESRIVREVQDIRSGISERKVRVLLRALRCNAQPAEGMQIQVIVYDTPINDRQFKFSTKGTNNED